MKNTNHLRLMVYLSPRCIWLHSPAPIRHPILLKQPLPFFQDEMYEKLYCSKTCYPRNCTSFYKRNFTSRFLFMNIVSLKSTLLWLKCLYQIMTMLWKTWNVEERIQICRDLPNELLVDPEKKKQFGKMKYWFLRGTYCNFSHFWY